MMDNLLISIIIPVHNEENNISPLIKRLTNTLNKYRHEIIFIDDGSKDKTVNNIKEEIKKNLNIKLLSFYRNFGHQMALSAGYLESKGDCVISIDADLQDPPELIPKLIKKWKEGNKVVYAKRQERQGEGLFKKITASFFYKLINVMSDVPIPKEVGDFRLLDKTVVKFINNLNEQPSFLRGLVAWGGFPNSTVYFVREKRLTGKTNYGLLKMLNFALEGITSFSTKPLRISTYLGITAGFLGLFGILYELIMKYIYPQTFVIGWAGLFTAIMFLGGIQLITIGIIGEYVGKTYREVQNRPRFLIKEKINL